MPQSAEFKFIGLSLGRLGAAVTWSMCCRALRSPQVMSSGSEPPGEHVPRKSGGSVRGEGGLGVCSGSEEEEGQLWAEQIISESDLI